MALLVAGQLPWSALPVRATTVSGGDGASSFAAHVDNGDGAAAASSAPVVTVNRTVPYVPPPTGLTFSAVPTDAEIFRARVFSEPLVPLGRAPRSIENVRLAAALRAYAAATRPEDVVPFTRFLDAHRDSPWRASLLVNLGEVYGRAGYARRALDVWNEAWMLTKDATDVYGRSVADRALAEWLTLTFGRGDVEATRRRLRETASRQVGGSAEGKVRNVRERLSILEHQPHLLVPAEQQALARLAAYTRQDAKPSLKTDDRSAHLPRWRTNRGESQAARRSWASTLRRALRLGLSLRPGVRRTTGRLLPRSLVQLRTGHAVAVLDAQGDRLLVYDPLLGDDRWIAAAALEEEAAGPALIAAETGPLPDGWDAAATTTAVFVTGMCPPGPPNDNDPPPADECEGDPPDSADDEPGDDDGSEGSSEGNRGEASSDCGTGPGQTAGHALARYRLHRLTAGLLVDDTPVGHRPPRGPAVFFHVRYNHRALFFPQVLSFANLGSKWTHDWLSYVDDLPVSCGGGGAGGDCTPAHARVVLRGGGYERHIPSGPTTYVRHWRSASELVRISNAPLRFERRLRDGSVEVFGLHDGTPPGQGARVFLTEIVDPRGQSVQLTYDSQFRLVSITDAVGQVTTLSYELTSDPLKITKVTDPFGRFAVFTYTATGQLASITDVIGLTSSFTYAGDFLTRLTTPYGATTFRKETDWQNDAFVRHIEAIDPLGGIERVEYRTELTTLPDSVPASEVPTGFTDFNGALDQFVSLYWDKRAMMIAPRDPASAVITSWLAENLFNHQWLGVSVPRYLKHPLEGRTWFAYPNQNPLNGEVGSWIQTAKVARVLDNGTSQIWQTTYNDHGMVTSQIDPLGRRTSYTYAANGHDLLEIRQTTGSLNDVLASYSNFTTTHRPQTIIDAAGQTNAITYNPSGQILTVTNAKNETTTYAYDTTGYLQSVTGPVSTAVVTYTYDPYGRIRTVTEPDGYAVTTDYDALDRPTRVTYPDASYEEITYDRLEAVSWRDRRGRMTRAIYDPVRRLTVVRDPQGRTVTQEWCGCGDLDALIDSKGQKTRWERDLQGRVTREVRADDTTSTQYTYEAIGGRLATVTDPKSQTTTYTYNIDDTVQQVAYTNAFIGTPPVSYTYDSNYGRVMTMVDGTGTTAYGYKAMGTLGASQLASVDGPLANDTVTYDYDELGRVTGRAINGAANERTQTYDALGRVTTETNPLGTFGYGYHGVTGRLASVTYPNGQTSAYAYYNNAGDRRLQTIHHKYANGSTLSKFDYTYDGLGNVLTWRQQMDTTDPTEWHYGYDAADQLLTAVAWSTSVTPAVLKRFAFTYDQVGNRIAEQIDDAVMASSYDAFNRLVSQQPGGLLRVTGSVNEPATVTIQGKPATVAADNQFTGGMITGSGTTTFSVAAVDSSGNTRVQGFAVNTSGTSRTLTRDGSGNMVSDGARTFEWDARNQLVAVTMGSHRSEFTYDGSRRRTRLIEKENGVVQSDIAAIWCDVDICEERDSSGAPLRRPFAQGEQLQGVSYLHTKDHLGSIRDVSNTASALTARFDYSPYGVRTTLAGTLDVTPGFTGHAVHTPSGLVLTLYRAYAPEHGNWLSDDPLGFDAGEAGLQQYVGNNPLSRVDVLGLQPLPRPGPGPMPRIPWVPWTTEPKDMIIPPQPKPTSIPDPKKPKCGCVCICRADADDTMPGNLRPDRPRFAFGYAKAKNCPKASKIAKRRATKTLGMKPKHIGCRCAGK